MKPQGYFNGVKVFVTESCVTSVPRRKHKKRRIQKKWVKRYGETLVPFRGLIGAELLNEKVLYCHPKHWDKFVEMSKKKGFEVTTNDNKPKM